MKISRTDDLEEIRELWVKLNEHHREKSVHFKGVFEGRTFEQRFENYGQNGTYTVFVAEENSTKLGYILASKNEKGIGEIDSLYLSKEARGKKVGEKLMNVALEYLEEIEAKNIHLVVAAGNEEAFGFYEKMGFVPRIHTLNYIKGNSKS